MEDYTNPPNSGTASYSDPLSTWVGVSNQDLAVEPASHQKAAEAGKMRTSPRLPIFMMSVARNRDFFGRGDYLNMIERAFFDASPSGAASIASESESLKTFSIFGSGGMGKTQLAARFVYKFQDRFDAIFWIHTDKAAKIAEGFGTIAAEFGLVDDDSPDARDTVVMWEQVRRWLVEPVKSDN